MTALQVADERILQGTTAKLSVRFRDQYGEDAEADGAVTVKVDRADGTAVLPAGTATTGTNPYSVELTPAQTQSLDVLQATWTAAGDGAVRASLHEVVGGFYFSVEAARAFDDSLADEGQYPDEKIRAVRDEVEYECERFCGLAFVPRYRRVLLDGRGCRDLLLPDVAPRAIRSARVYSSPTSFAAFTAEQLAALDVLPSGIIVRRDGASFAAGTSNVLVEYEHGLDAPPPELRHAALSRLRYRLNMEKTSTTLDTAARYTTPDGTVFEAVDGDEFGQREVFRTYKRHSAKAPGHA